MNTAMDWKDKEALPQPIPASQAASTWRTRLAEWQDAAREPALSVLLAVQVVFIFVVEPLVNTGVLPHWLLEVFQLLLPLVSFFVMPRRSKVRPLILLTAGPILALELIEDGVFAGLLLRMLVTVAITILVARAVFRAENVTTHQLLGAVVVYLNLALLFMGIFSAIRHAVPAAFETFTHQPLKPGELLYYSITTLTSTGYGDLLPVHPLARSMSNLEAVSGQLFLGTFLARVVTLHGRKKRS
ncbi:potassium channel family protein [Hymenobacter properus]|uniref:Potassium channel domain-containing protein n=1 Tax=Hymenobacter properus TaxID=2791026 RepID=A0A931BLY4_9BACT|nr:potassium channel family protein [Hymenobacter properus]MBF9142683.1 hypothetical protein [Hymenobacter properus]MBR7721491.1 hypothetical protein [Microvirga sp. SRT04]